MSYCVHHLERIARPLAAALLAGVQAMKPQSLAESARFYADETRKFGRMARSIKLAAQ